MNLNNYIINKNDTVNDALKKLNEHSSDILVLFVVSDNNKLIGSLTDGDIRRGLINKIGLNDTVDKVMFKQFVFAEKGKLNETIQTINNENIKLLPVVNEKGIIIEIINLLTYTKKLPIEAFIMAGGEGKRLLPLTKETPKPLLKVGGKPIIEHNIDRLKIKGIDKIYISVNYLRQQLKDYFKDGTAKEIEIIYIEENEPLGTIGSLSLVNEFKQDTILLMNSDLLTNFDLVKMYQEFIKQDADLMLATIPYQVSIPYAVMEIKDNKISAFKEKPTYTYQSNAGIYLLKKEIVNLIPKHQFYNATDLLEKMIALNKNVCYYPILGYWLDIGKHEDFEKAQKDIFHIKF